MEILIYYVLPNIALFGGIYLFAKGIEKLSWYLICNYETTVNYIMKGTKNAKY